jgi:hypothetical protein
MNETTTSWDNSTTIVWIVVAMQLIIFFFYVHNLRSYIDPPDDLPDNSLYRLTVESIQDYV